MSAGGVGPDAAESQRVLELGGLPPDATRRLQDNAGRQGTPGHVFTTNLSVNEFLLTRDCGYEPLGQVMGCSVFHVGWQWQSFYSSQELDVLTQANRAARDRAFDRLRQEAAILRADGVVGIRLVRNVGQMAEEAVELQAIGTAVRRIGSPPSNSSSPFLSNLSGQDHWALRKSGMRPIGFVFGNCTWYELSGWSNQQINFWTYGNRELPGYTQGVYTARELALTRLESEARQLGSRGVVGVVIEPQIRFVDRQGQNGVQDMIAEFTVYGTAIDAESGSARDSSSVTTNVSLNDA